MSDRTTDECAPWWTRLWVRLTSRRATAAEIEAEEVTEADARRMLWRLHTKGHLTPMHAAVCPFCKSKEPQ